MEQVKSTGELEVQKWGGKSRTQENTGQGKERQHEGRERHTDDRKRPGQHKRPNNHGTDMDKTRQKCPHSTIDVNRHL